MGRFAGDRFTTAGRALVVGTLVASWLLGPSATAYESDQYSHRSTTIDDSSALLNEQVNAALEAIVADWRHGRDDRRFAHQVYKRLGGFHWVDRIERWAIRSPSVDKLPTRRYRNIYRGVPLCAARVTKLAGVGVTIRIGDVLVGSDKLGHFMSQGLKFYRRWRRSGSEEQAARRGRFTEAGVFGQFFTGIFSNADLVANYEGYRFYRSLFEDGVVPGKPAIVRFEGAQATLVRPFDWRDHVNPYWDEALNPNHFDRLLRRHMLPRLRALCPRVEAAPGRWRVPGRASLEARYAHIGMRSALGLRMSVVCGLEP